MGARMFTLENYGTILDQIYSPEGFRPTYGQNYLAELLQNNLELATGLNDIIACTEKLHDLQRHKGVERILTKHIGQEDLATLLRDREWGRVLGLQNGFSDGSGKVSCSSVRKMLKRLCALTGAFHIVGTLSAT